MAKSIDVEIPNKLIPLFQGKADYRGASGSRGCMRDNTEIVTHGGIKNIADLVPGDDVLSWNETGQKFQLAPTSGAYPKGKGNLYRVITTHGELFASEFHHVLCADGEYRPLAFLDVGNEVLSCSQSPVQTSLESDRIWSPSNDLHYWETALDLTDDYELLQSRYGQQLLLALDTCRSLFPLQDDARISSHHLSGKGVQLEPLRGHSQQDQSYALQPMMDSYRHTSEVLEQVLVSCMQAKHDKHTTQLIHKLQQFVLMIASHQPHFLRVQLSQGSSGFSYGDTRRLMASFLADQGGEQPFVRISQLIQLSLQFLSMLEPHLRFVLFAQLLTDLRVLLASQSSSFPSLNNSLSSISNCSIIHKERLKTKEWYWDMHVAGNNNYVTSDGTIHHNSAKTFTFAKILAYIGAQKKCRIVCARELQTTLSDSVFHEVANAIASCPYLTSQYEVGKSYIHSKIGTEFLFKSLRANISEFKGLAHITHLWVDEAEQVSAESWRDVIPTIRDEGSEIWATWNPKDPGSPVKKIFIDGANSDETNGKSIIKHVEINWRDNPWFPEKLNRERLRCLDEDDEDIYNHIWEGKFLTVSGRTVFDKKHMANAEKECYKPKKRMTFLNNKFIDHSTGDLKVWHEPRTGASYAISADVAEGLANGDYSSVDILEITGETVAQAAQWHGHIAPDLLANLLLSLAKWYNNGYIICEANNHGILTNTVLRDSYYPHVYVSRQLDDRGGSSKETRRIGFQTTSKSKPFILDLLAKALREKTHGIACLETVKELQTYVIEDNGSTNASKGCYDDRVMSYALANYLAEQVRSHNV